MTVPTFIIYGTHTCSFCKAAQNYLTQKGYQYEMKYIDGNQELLAEFKTLLPEAKTVPQIFMVLPDFTEHVGGYDQLVSSLMNPTQGM